LIEQKRDLRIKQKIRLFVSDIDGTLTDGGMYYSSGGECLKKFNTRDGMAFELMRDSGVKTALITSETSEINFARSEKLQIDYLVQGERNQGKLAALRELCKELDIELGQVAYIGDDINCIDVLEAVGYPACPADASQSVRKIRDIRVMKTAGGDGAVREFADLLIG